MMAVPSYVKKEPPPKVTRPGPLIEDAGLNKWVLEPNVSVAPADTEKLPVLAPPLLNLRFPDIASTVPLLLKPVFSKLLVPAPADLRTSPALMKFELLRKRALPRMSNVAPARLSKRVVPKLRTSPEPFHWNRPLLLQLPWRVRLPVSSIANRPAFVKLPAVVRARPLRIVTEPSEVLIAKLARASVRWLSRLMIEETPSRIRVAPLVRMAALGIWRVVCTWKVPPARVVPFRLVNGPSRRTVPVWTCMVPELVTTTLSEVVPLLWVLRNRPALTKFPRGPVTPCITASLRASRVLAGRLFQVPPWKICRGPASIQAARPALSSVPFASCLGAGPEMAMPPLARRWPAPL